MNEDAVAICRLKKAYESLLSAEKMEELTRATDEQVINAVINMIKGDRFPIENIKVM